MLQKMVDLVLDPDDAELVKETYLSLAIQGVLTSETALPNLEWPRTPFSELANFKAGRTPARQEMRYWKPEEIPWVSIADLVNDGVVEHTKEKVSSAAQDEVFKAAPSAAGTLLMSFKLTIGKISRLGVDAYFNEAIIAIEPKELVTKDYLTLALPSIARGGESKNAVKGKTLNRDSLSKLVIPVPPADEQDRIVKMVRSFFEQLDGLALSLETRNAARKNALRGLSHKILAEVHETLESPGALAR
jgi:type I restriction enzyme S subunit